MAEESTQEVVNAWTCSICIDTFKDPKLLPCFHTFCSACLEQYAGKTAVQGRITCPVCRSTHQLPQTGAKGFQSNFYIEADVVKEAHRNANCDICSTVAGSRCMECEQNFCEGCLKFHNSMNISRNHSVFSLSESPEVYPPLHRPKFCHKHKGEALRFLCIACEKPVCRDCKLTSHEGHRTKDLEDVVIEGCAELKRLRDILKEKLFEFGEKIASLTKRQDKISKCQITICDSIRNDADQIVKQVYKMRDDKIASVSHSVSKIIATNKLSLTSMEQERESLENRLTHTNHLIEKGHGSDVMVAVSQMRNVLDSTEKCEAFNSLPCTSTVLPSVVRVSRVNKREIGILVNVRVIPFPELLIVENWFECSSSAQIDVISPVKEDRAFVALRSLTGRCSLVLFDSSGSKTYGFHILTNRYERCRSQGITHMMHLEVQHEKSDEITALQKMVTLKPKPHCDTQDDRTCSIDDAKDTVRVRAKSGERELELAPLNSNSVFIPKDVCFGRNGDILVADYGSNTVIVYSPADDSIKSFVIEGHGSFRPVAIAVSQNGKMWIGGDNGLIWICKYY